MMDIIAFWIFNLGIILFLLFIIFIFFVAPFLWIETIKGKVVFFLIIGLCFAFIWSSIAITSERRAEILHEYAEGK